MVISLWADFLQCTTTVVANRQINAHSNSCIPNSMHTINTNFRNAYQCASNSIKQSNTDFSRICIHISIGVREHCSWISSMRSANSSKIFDKYVGWHAVNRIYFVHLMKSLNYSAIHWITDIFELVLSFCGPIVTGLCVRERMKTLQIEIVLIAAFSRFSNYENVCSLASMSLVQNKNFWPFNLSSINKNRRHFGGESLRLSQLTQILAGDKWALTRKCPIINVIIIKHFEHNNGAILQKMAPNRFNE